MSELFWFTGFLVWIASAVYGACLIGWVAWCFVVAIDWMRWALATGKGPTVWRHVPGAFLRRWLYFVTRGTTATTWHCPRGGWDGFRKWTAYPPQPLATKETA